MLGTRAGCGGDRTGTTRLAVAETGHFAGTPSPSLLRRLLKERGVEQNDSLAGGYLFRRLSMWFHCSLTEFPLSFCGSAALPFRRLLLRSRRLSMQLHCSCAAFPCNSTAPHERGRRSTRPHRGTKEMPNPVPSAHVLSLWLRTGSAHTTAPSP